MLTATVLAIFYIPLFFVLVRRLFRGHDKAEASPGNLLFFDIQDDQAPGVDSIVRAAGYDMLQRTPIVTMRIAAINDREDSPLHGDIKLLGVGQSPRDTALDAAELAAWTTVTSTILNLDETITKE